MPYRGRFLLRVGLMSRLTASSLSKLLLAATFCSITAAPARAGFLDALFGRPAAPVYRAEPETDPLNVTVRKKARVKKPAAPKELPAVALQKPTLDPFKDPHWYLKDETLRRGDIVVLPNRVLVLRDSSSNLRPSAFEDVRRTTSLSNRERARILAITEFQGGSAPKYRIVPETTVAASTINRLDRSTVPVIMP
jgi:hypothetical protein